MSAMTKKEWMAYIEKTWDAAQKEAWADQQPTKREWVGLTDNDLRQIILAAVGVAEAKLKEKNHG